MADEIAYDPRFVYMVPAGEEPPFSKSGQNCHTCMIINVYPALLAGIDFYGQQYYVVNFGNIQLNRHIMHVHSFDYVNKANRSLSISDIFKLLKKR